MRGAKSILAAAVCAVMLLLPAAFAQAAELMYWGNFGGRGIAFADLAGNGGGPLNLSGVVLDGPEGLAIDSATGRLFVADAGGAEGRTGQILAVNLDGSGTKVFSAPGAPVVGPAGIAIDPGNRMAYWSNSETNTISWARLDGSAGGTVNTAGARVAVPVRVALDLVGQRIYWVNAAVPESISFARLDGSGGGDLDIGGAGSPQDINGLSVDPAAGRLYWLDDDRGAISFASLAGGGGGDLALSANASFASAYGLALDPTVGRFYWGNFGGDRTTGIGFADLSGVGAGAIGIARAPVDGPQDPIVLKSPTGTAVPVVTRSAQSRSSLSCSTGTWASDFAGSFVYRAPSRFAYQWLRDGQPVAGATAASLNAIAPGAYACTVTASNQAGPAAQTSAATSLKAATLRMSVKRKVKAKPGKVARLKLRVENVGDVTSRSDRICVKVPKRAKALKAPRCKLLGVIPGGVSRAEVLKLRVGAAASGTYRVKLTVKGAPAKPAKAKILVASK